MLHSDNDNGLRFLSVCSGIEAASVAWGPLGWLAVAFGEIDKNASALLACRYPDVPNLGDFTKIDAATLGRVDILCGGTPCQAFSVAGARRGLDDERGNLSLEFVRLAHELADSNGLRNAVWENVPGVLTMSDNAFGCFLAGIVGADGPFVPVERKPAEGRSTRWWRWSEKEKVHAVCWPSYGMVSGPKGRAAWAVKDAQFFGLAQRRERVLVVADFGNGADPAAVLFERVSVPWNPPARGEAREGVAGTISARSSGGGGLGTDFELGGGLQAIPAADVVGCLAADMGGGNQFAASGQFVGYTPEIARCVATREGSSQDYESTTMVAVSGTLTATYGEQSGQDMLADGLLVTSEAVCVTGTVTHTLTTEGADASEDGTGRGTPIIAFLHANKGRPAGRKSKHTEMVTVESDTVPTLTTDGHQQSAVVSPICFTAKDYGADAQEDIAPTLRAGGHKDSHQNGGVTPAVTIAIRGREGGATAELGGSVATALRASQGGGDKPHVLAFQNHGSNVEVCGDVTGTLPTNADRASGGAPMVATSAVRRLTPRECERLQGFQWQCSPDYPGAWQDEAGRWWSPDYTRIPVRKYATKKVTKNRPDDMWSLIDGEWWLMAADGPRYKQLGNSWAVPKFRWLGKRIQRLMPKDAANANEPEAAKAAA